MTRLGMGSYGTDGERHRKDPVEVSLFVHRVLKASLLCSEHGRNEYLNRELVDGKIIPWSVITWPDERQLKAFRSWEMQAHPLPAVFNFAVQEWIAYEKGLI